MNHEQILNRVRDQLTRTKRSISGYKTWTDREKGAMAIIDIVEKIIAFGESDMNKQKYTIPEGVTNAEYFTIMDAVHNIGNKCGGK